MTEKTRTKRKLKKPQEETEKANGELESITVLYNGKDYTVHFPNNADAKLICQSIKRETGVRGSFYVHFGDQSNNYLHCSSVTRGNLAKLAGKTLEVRGGNGKLAQLLLQFVSARVNLFGLEYCILLSLIVFSSNRNKRNYSAGFVIQADANKMYIS